MQEENEFYDNCLDFKDLATFLNISERHTRKLVADGEIPFFKVGSLTRFDPDRIIEWKKERENKKAESKRKFDEKDARVAFRKLYEWFHSTEDLLLADAAKRRANEWEKNATKLQRDLDAANAQLAQRDNLVLNFRDEVIKLQARLTERDKQNVELQTKLKQIEDENFDLRGKIQARQLAQGRGAAHMRRNGLMRPEDVPPAPRKETEPETRYVDKTVY